MHLFVWGSIVSWFVVIPITSSPGLYGGLNLFLYNGVAYEVLGSATFWFYLPLAIVLALLPTIVFRVVRLNLWPHLIDDVRLKEKKEGRRIFRRKLFHRKPPEDLAATLPRSTKRSGYAFSHKEGFAKMITTGHIFGMNENEVEIERHRRLSQYIRTSRPVSPTDHALSTAAEASLNVVASPIVTIEIVESQDTDVVQKKEEEEGTIKEKVETVEQVPLSEADNIEQLADEKEDEISNTDTEEVVIGDEPDVVPSVESGGGDMNQHTGGEDMTDSILIPGKFSINLPGSVESPEKEEEKEKSKTMESDDKSNM